MNKAIRKLIGLIGILGVASSVSFAQNRTSFGGIRNAYSYAFGVSGGPGALIIDNPSPIAAGTATITVAYGSTTAGDGTVFAPLSTTTAIVVGSGGTQETVTPTAVSCSTPTLLDSCTFTATFTNAHGRGEQIASSTIGLGEAVNVAHAKGGLVAVDGVWVAYGGLTTTITGQKGWTNVTVLDWRGTTGAHSYIASSNGVVYAASSVTLY